MDTSLAAGLAELGTALSILIVKNTTSAINTKIKTIREEKNIERVRATYDEIINELLIEREEAIRIAQTYKMELDRIEISDEDIQHLNNTVGRILDLLRVMSPNIPLDTFEQLKQLISVDTLKTIQLLGFNYKAAIGEPLTQICAEAILSKAKTKNYVTRSKK